MSDHLTAALVVEQLWHAVPGGSGTYVRELSAALLDAPATHPVGVAAHHGHAAATWRPPCRLTIVESRLPRTVLYETWSRWRRPRTARRVTGADVVHATTWAIPPATAPLIVTVHDLAFLDTPAHFTSRGNGWFRRALEITRDEAAAIIAVSSTTRDACIAAGIDAARVTVVPHGVRIPDTTPEAAADLRARLGLDRPYILWAGTVEPRKNVAQLVRAFNRAVDEGLDLDLVLVGPPGWGKEEAAVDAAMAAAPSDRVHRTGALSFADLHAAYAAASAFAFPSLQEGFGMPVLEAMAHGLPVLTSTGTSMAEIGGEAVHLVDPRDGDDLAEGLLSIAGARHDELASTARARAQQFSWRTCAEATAAVYRQTGLG